MRRSFFMLLLLALVAAFGLAACGGGGESEAEKEAEAAAKEAGSEITCEGSAMTGETGLPATFPAPTGVTYVKSTQTGPTLVVPGPLRGRPRERLRGLQGRVRVGRLRHPLRREGRGRRRGLLRGRRQWHHGAGSTEGRMRRRGPDIGQDHESRRVAGARALALISLALCVAGCGGAEGSLTRRPSPC